MKSLVGGCGVVVLWCWENVNNSIGILRLLLITAGAYIDNIVACLCHIWTTTIHKQVLLSLGQNDSNNMTSFHSEYCAEQTRAYFRKVCWMDANIFEYTKLYLAENGQSAQLIRGPFESYQVHFAYSWTFLWAGFLRMLICWRGVWSALCLADGRRFFKKSFYFAYSYFFYWIYFTDKLDKVKLYSKTYVVMCRHIWELKPQIIFLISNLV